MELMRKFFPFVRLRLEFNYQKKLFDSTLRTRGSMQHIARFTKPVCVHNESNKVVVFCTCFFLYYLFASFVFAMVKKRWMDGGFSYSHKHRFNSFACDASTDGSLAVSKFSDNTKSALVFALDVLWIRNYSFRPLCDLGFRF